MIRWNTHLWDVAASVGSFICLRAGWKSTGCVCRLSLASRTVLILSMSSAGQQRAGCPQTDKALKPRADAAPPKGTVTRSCVTAPNESKPLFHRSSCRQFRGCGGGGDWNGGRALKCECIKVTRVSSFSSHRPTSLNSGSAGLEPTLVCGCSLAVRMCRRPLCSPHWLCLTRSESEQVLISTRLLAWPRSIPQGHSSTSTRQSSTWNPNFNVTWEN